MVVLKEQNISRLDIGKYGSFEAIYWTRTLYCKQRIGYPFEIYAAHLSIHVLYCGKKQPAGVLFYMYYCTDNKLKIMLTCFYSFRV